MKTFLRILLTAAPMLPAAALQALAAVGYAASNPDLSTLCMVTAIVTAVCGVAGGIVDVMTR